MESYSEQLERECKETEEKFPDVQKIVNEILRINRISDMDFDYNIERRHLMYENVKKILNCDPSPPNPPKDRILPEGGPIKPPKRLQQTQIKMNKYAKEILILIDQYLENNPDIRFAQALFNLDINEFANKIDPEDGNFMLRDPYNDKDSDVLKRIKTNYGK